MKKVMLLALLTCAFAVGGASQLSSVNKVKEERDATIIVKMKTKVDDFSQDELLAKQNSLLDEISQTVTSNYRVKTRYSNIFNGFVLDIPSAYVSKVRHLNRVDKVNYNRIIAEENNNNDGFKYEIKVKEPSASGQTMNKPENTNEGSGTFIAILDNGFYIQTAEDGTQTYHNVFKPLDAKDVVVTQASLKAKIDAAGDKFHGKYDAKHSTYYNNKIPFYYDYGGDTRGAVEPDYDVYAEGQDHGTHVASIAGGNAGDEYEGIAPRAQMALMKVFTTYLNGQTYSSGAYADAVLNALEDCLVLGVDSINMSLGSNLNDFDDASIVEDVIRSLDSKGQFVNVAAGNEGKGQWSNTVYRYWQSDMVEGNIISTYANNLGATTVASSQADFQFYGEALTIDGVNLQYSDQVTNYNSTSGKVEYTPQRYLMDLLKSGKDEFDFVYLPGIGTVAEYNDVNVSGKIVVTNRGDITFKEKVDNAVAKGAIAIGIIDNTNSTEFNFRMSFSDNNSYNPAIPVFSILNKDQSVFADSVSKRIKLLKDTVLDNPNAKTISDYSSDGMRYDFAIKPEIATPGENIKGAVIGGVDKYESMSGTSMATPNLSGTVALMIGEHIGDANYRKTIKARLMSTAQPMKDTTPEHNYTSVRRQGAGLANIGNALSSKVYLDGLDNEGKQIGKAKIELQNNADIAKGDVKLSFAAINEDSAAVTYEAKTYVLAPKLDTYSEEIYPEFANQKFQTIDEQLVEVFTDTVTANPGVTTLNINHSISSDKLAALNADFETGCILEGYVILTATGKAQLSIPFLGYYGDVSKVSPVEPFDFEKEEGKVYNSDILNYLITQSIGNSSNGDFTKADYASHILSGYWSDMSKVSVSEVIKNLSSLKKTLDENKVAMKLVGTDPYSGQLTNNLVVGNNGYSNTIIFQQYVNRSVKTNNLTLKNKATGETILVDHMFDALMGSDYDSTTGVTSYPLYKSHFDTSLYDSGYFAHRAYSIVPMFKTENKKKVNYPDGEYELKFEYFLSAGSTFTKTYTLTIESELPVLQSIEKAGNNYRFSYKDTNVAVVNVNGKAYPITIGDKGCYAEVPASEFASSDKAFVVSTDKAFAQESFLTNLNDQNRVMASNKSFNTATDLTYEVSGENTNDQTFTFSFTANGKVVSTNGDIVYRMAVPKGLDKKTLVVNAIQAGGKEKVVKYTEINDTIQFSSALKSFHLTSDPVEGAAVLTGISVSGPTTTKYDVGAKLDLTGLVVTAHYSDGSERVLKESDYTVSEVDMSTAGKKTVTVTYKEMVATFTIQVGASSGCGGSLVMVAPILLIALAGVLVVILNKKRQLRA